MVRAMIDYNKLVVAVHATPIVAPSIMLLLIVCISPSESSPTLDTRRQQVYD